MFLSGDFARREEVIEAIQRLRTAGVTGERVDLYSDEPVEIPRDVLPRRSLMSLGAVCGALVTSVLVIGFVYYSQHNYPLITGGMPIFTPWATGVVFYELTMLGAILTTFGWFLWESGILRKKRRGPLVERADGRIAVRVECSGEQSDILQRVLREAGAENVRELRA